MDLKAALYKEQQEAQHAKEDPVAAAARKSRRSAGIDLSQHARRNAGVEGRDRLDREQIKVVYCPKTHGVPWVIKELQWMLNALVRILSSQYLQVHPNFNRMISGCSRHQRIAWQRATRHWSGKHNCMIDWSLSSTMMRMSCTM